MAVEQLDQNRSDDEIPQVEVTSFSMGGCGVLIDEVVHMYRYKTRARESVEREEHADLSSPPPLFSVTSSSGSEQRSQRHEELNEVFTRLFGDPGVTKLQLRRSENLSINCECPLRPLYSFLQSKLSSAFGAGTIEHPVEEFECYVNCGQVTVGGFGATWHRDATSQLTFEGNVCEYLALYYLEPCQQNTHHWLECSLDERPSLKSFVPLSTMDHSLLVLRNDQMLHRTPLLSNLISGQMRRFFYMPFRALDSHNQPVALLPPKNAKWHAYSADDISRTILHALSKNEFDMNLEAYVEAKIMHPNVSEESTPDLSSCIFGDPDDY
jgi:hypothetical protein